jgi:hypothetical protein
VCVTQSGYDGTRLDLSPGYRGGGGQVASGARSMLFAGTILGLIGVSNVIDGVAALSGSDVVPASTVVEFGSVRFWGFVMLAAGVVTIAASFAIFTKSGAARNVGIVVASANALTELLAIPAHPWWGVCALALDLLVVKALVAHGGRDVFAT